MLSKKNKLPILILIGVVIVLLGVIIFLLQKGPPSASGDVEFNARGYMRGMVFSINQHNNSCIPRGQCLGSGTLLYTDVQSEWYQVAISCVNIQNSTALFSGKVVSASKSEWMSNWLIVKIRDRTDGDQISADFHPSDPQCSPSGLVSGTFDVTQGDIIIN